MKGAVGLLVSGGLDSAVLIEHFRRQRRAIVPVYIRCGFPWESAEVFWARKFLRALNDPEISSIKILSISLDDAGAAGWAYHGRIPGRGSADTSVFLPARNLLLVTKAFLFLTTQGVNRLAVGTLKGNPFRDATSDYMARLERLLSDSFNRKLRVLGPFRRRTKSSIVKLASPAAIRFSFSCLAPVGMRHCGACNKCEERRRAFRRAECSDEAEFAETANSRPTGRTETSAAVSL